MNRRHFLGSLLTVSLAPSAFARNREPDKKYRLNLHHTHTDESLELVYRVGSQYQRGALKKLNYFLRDYRTDDIAVIDPALYDMLYLLQHRVRNYDAPFEIVSAYRSLETNEELRRTSSAVAKNSLHIKGQALDIRLRRTRTSALRDAAIGLQRGGVGYYRRADFVHVDTGEIRRWSA